MRAAFLLPANLAAVGMGMSASALAGEPTGLLITAGAEGVWLLMVSAFRPFQRAVRAREGAREFAEKDEESALLDELAVSQREHYFVLKEVKERILANYRKLPGGRVLVASSEQQVSALLQSFLRLLVTLNSYRKYLNIGERKTVERELYALRAEVEAEKNERLRDVKQKRVDILAKRMQRFEQADESREVVSHQLAGIEDLLRLTHEQSIAIRDPESVNRQLDVLTAEVQATEETVRELERFMDFQDELGPRPSEPVRVR